MILIFIKKYYIALNYSTYKLIFRSVMLEILLGSVNKERVLLYLVARKSGYSREIARFYETDLTPIQSQLRNLENANILASQTVGKTRVYSLNPRYPFNKELTNLLEKVIYFLPDDEKQKLLVFRARPRRAGKE